jgi:hypothetical protein
MISELWIIEDMEGSGIVLIADIMPAFVWRDWGKPQTTSVRIARLQAENWIAVLLNTEKENLDVRINPLKPRGHYMYHSL